MRTSLGPLMGGIALLYLSSICHLTASHALPRQTTTIDFRDLDVIDALPWPLATAAPELLRPRQLWNTVCGYVGGDPDLPATCSAGSHCAVDLEHGAIGCCPDGGTCTQGVFTGCVDGNSGPQIEVNPYVYTCGGGNVCYRNSFEGGFFQYGCGSASDIGTSVHGTASGKERVEITSLSAQLTATPKVLSEPTTLGAVMSSTKTSSGVSSSTTATSKSSSATTQSTGTKSAAAKSASSESASRTSSAQTSATSTDAASAPNTEGDDNGKKHTGAIIGGTISGVAALVAVIALGIWLWRRKKGNTRQGPGLKADSQYVSPVQQGQHNFAPVASGQEMDQVGNYPPAPPASFARGGITQVTSDGRTPSPEPYTTNGYGYGYPPDSALGGSASLDNDQVPLTREEARDPDGYGYGYGHGLTRIEEEDNPRPATGGGSMHSPRGGGGGPFFQQNRGPGWF